MFKKNIAKMTEGTPLPSPPVPSRLRPSPPVPSRPLPSPPSPPLPSPPLPTPPLPSPPFPLSTQRIHSPFQPTQSPSSVWSAVAHLSFEGVQVRIIFLPIRNMGNCVLSAFTQFAQLYK